MTEKWKPVKLAAKVIGHISQGMYRTPAGALKELISNAHDAGATYAKIHTGFPSFTTFSCEDDGTGISKDKFIQLMEGGLGESDKQTGDGQIGRNGRPIIGRLGVGLVSLAQICSRFSVHSFHEPTRTAFEAEIKFPPYSRQDIDRATKESPKSLVNHGEYRYTDIPYEEGKHGIIVTTTALRDMFRKTMSNLDSYAHKQFFKSSESYPSFSRFIEAIANPKLSSLSFASQYDQLLFGLALASPIPYVEPSDSKSIRLDTVVTKIPQISQLQKDLKHYDFRVEVDNIELRRPVILPSNKLQVKPADCLVPKSSTKIEFELTDGVYSEKITVDKYDIVVKNTDERFQLFLFDYSRKVNGYPLQFSGYIFLQTSRLFPKEYQGILIRLKTNRHELQKSNASLEPRAPRALHSNGKFPAQATLQRSCESGYGARFRNSAISAFSASISADVSLTRLMSPSTTTCSASSSVCVNACWKARRARSNAIVEVLKKSAG